MDRPMSSPKATIGEFNWRSTAPFPCFGLGLSTQSSGVMLTRCVILELFKMIASNGRPLFCRTVATVSNRLPGIWPFGFVSSLRSLGETGTDPVVHTTVNGRPGPQRSGNKTRPRHIMSPCAARHKWGMYTLGLFVRGARTAPVIRMMILPEAVCKPPARRTSHFMPKPKL